MDNQVLQLDEYRPHICLVTPNGNAHVIPEVVFEKIISGELEITDMDDWQPIVKTIITEWLRRD